MPIMENMSVFGGICRKNGMREGTWPRPSSTTEHVCFPAGLVCSAVSPGARVAAKQRMTESVMTCDLTLQGTRLRAEMEKWHRFTWKPFRTVSPAWRPEQPYGKLQCLNWKNCVCIPEYSSSWLDANCKKICKEEATLTWTQRTDKCCWYRSHAQNYKWSFLSLIFFCP